MKLKNKIARLFKSVTSSKSYFCTKEWQAGEAEADRDIAAGNISGPFDNAEDVVKSLKGYKE